MNPTDPTSPSAAPSPAAGTDVGTPATPSVPAAPTTSAPVPPNPGSSTPGDATGGSGNAPIGATATATPPAPTDGAGGDTPTDVTDGLESVPSGELRIIQRLLHAAGYPASTSGIMDSDTHASLLRFAADHPETTHDDEGNASTGPSEDGLFDALDAVLAGILVGRDASATPITPGIAAQSTNTQIELRHGMSLADLAEEIDVDVDALVAANLKGLDDAARARGLDDSQHGAITFAGTVLVVPTSK